MHPILKFYTFSILGKTNINWTLSISKIARQTLERDDFGHFFGNFNIILKFPSNNWHHNKRKHPAIEESMSMTLLRTFLANHFLVKCYFVNNNLPEWPEYYQCSTVSTYLARLFFTLEFLCFIFKHQSLFTNDITIKVRFMRTKFQHATSSLLGLAYII